MLSSAEREELNQLRKSAHRWMSDPLDRVCFELESILDRPEQTKLDAILPTSVARALIRAVLLLKNRSDQCRCDIK